MSNIAFRVVRGLETNILAMPFVDGYVYVAIDTKRIYMDTYLNNIQQNKLSIGGGNSGIYYANKTFMDSSDLNFNIDDIEGNDLPGIDDLIINYKSNNQTRDGFYRVIASNPVTNSVETVYLPVGGGGGSTSGTFGKIIITPITSESGITTSEIGYEIEYIIEAYNNADAPIATPGRISYTINGQVIDGGEVLHGDKVRFPVTQYLDSTKDYNSITVTATFNTGGVVADRASYTWLVKCIDLKLEWEYVYSSKNYIKEDTFNLNWKVTGGIDCVTHIMIDDKTDDTHYFRVNILASETEGNYTLNAQPYGAHKFTMWLTAKVGTVDISSNKINHILTFINGEETSAILTVPFFQEQATQYDTLNIPFLLYKPNTEKLLVNFYAEGILILAQEYETSSDVPHYWPYTVGHAGEVKLKIAFAAYPEIEEEIILQVKPLNLGIAEPVQGLNFSLKASDISGNAQLQKLEEEGKISFSNNFDWINGGLHSEIDSNGSINNYICVRQGTRMIINYELFKNSQVSTQGKTFKFCFKAVNCYSYEAPVLECYEESTELGLKFNAQQALFSSSANNNFTTQYCEGSYIELETEIWPDQRDDDKIYKPGDRFLMFWVDGVPSGVQVFDQGTNFIQNNPKYITIGSDECDVYLYVIKIYERRLSNTEHLNNFILDAPSVNEKINRFNRNNILGPNGEISYEKLIKQNPGCHAYLYKLTVNGMTINKEDEKDCDYTEYYLDSTKPYITAKNAKILVQGTSSAAYGVAAYNVRTDFGDTIMYDKDGNQLEGRKVSETSIPVDYTCTKVNVASCENANNALNAEWYNRFQPYYDGHRRKSTATKQYRDCMEFDFGVMFIEDHNEKSNFTDPDGKPDASLYPLTNVFAYNTKGEKDNSYLKSPYYKQYAIANMGNDKKNREVFHDIKNYKACCVEILDNQNAEYWMTKDTVTLDDFKWNDEDSGFYEFRYSVDKYKGNDEIPDGLSKSEYEKVQAQAFLDFVKWMASCDPSPRGDGHPNGYTDEPLDQPVIYPEKTFSGFIPEGWDNSTSSGVSLAGFTTNKYAGEYTHDTKKYRIAKMLNECEDHLVMDSVVYHYLFIQRHTMVDNVAKNTFWSTEDLQHWDLTKNYDNDTSDGNDNSGYLTFTYGKEIMDRKENGKEVFNASDSVWLNFIFNLPDVQENLYSKLLNKQINGVNVWDATGYLKLFKEKQSLIPERCWIEDYFRKYIRPRRLGLDGSNNYLQRLEGGKKTHQRQQYETYQSYYIDSKYCAGTSFSDTGSFDMRLNEGNAIYKPVVEFEENANPKALGYYEYVDYADSVTGAVTQEYIKTKDEVVDESKTYFYRASGGWTTNESFPVKYYIDLYPSAHIGGQYWRGDRTKRGSEGVAIPVGKMLDSPNDATCYIYAASMLQSIKGISDTYPNYMGISYASKLRELEAGSNIEDYFNRQLNNAVLNQNTQLEKAQLQQVGSEKLTGLDLSNLAMLKELKINMGSTFPTLKLAKGCIIETLWLNPLKSLNVKGLKQLKDFKYDEEIFESLTNICIQDCPMLNNFSYRLAMYNKIARYCFNDIEWQVPTEDITIGEDTSINVLENLLSGNKGFEEVGNQALALTGKLIVNLSDELENNILDEYAIYAKYKKSFPNLDIEYIGNLNSIKAAKTITFYNDYSNGVYGDKIYEVKTDGNQNLGFLISASGPLGTAIVEKPTKESDKEWDYNWNEDSGWIDQDGKPYTDIQMKELVPNNDMIFRPNYIKTKHLYTVTLRDYDGTDIENSIGGQEYKSEIGDLMPIYMYRHHNTKGMRYEFQGWISARDYLGGTSSPEILTKFIIEDDTTYYAYYEEQNCLTKASRLDYFDFKGIDGATIALNEKYKFLIQEPITLPLKNGSIGITTIAGFGVEPNYSGIEKVKIPEIYFLNNGIGGFYKSIGGHAFYSQNMANMPNQQNAKNLLREIYLPESIVNIEESAFEGCAYLEDVHLPNALKENIGITSIGIYAFNSTGILKIEQSNEYDPFAKLKTIGVSAFYKAGRNIYINKLSSPLIGIQSFALSQCENISIEDFSNVQSLGNDALSGSGKNKMINIILPTSLENFADDCFSGYAINNINTVTYKGGGLVDDATLAKLGLSFSNPTTIEQVIE